MAFEGTWKIFPLTTRKRITGWAKPTSISVLIWSSWTVCLRTFDWRHWFTVSWKLEVKANILWVICFRFNQGQAGGEPFQRECRGSGEDAFRADRRDEEEAPPAGADDPGSLAPWLPARSLSRGLLLLTLRYEGEGHWTVPSNPAAPAAAVRGLHKFSFRSMSTMAFSPRIPNAFRFVARPETLPPERWGPQSLDPTLNPRVKFLNSWDCLMKTFDYRL